MYDSRWWSTSFASPHQPLDCVRTVLSSSGRGPPWQMQTHNFAGQWVCAEVTPEVCAKGSWAASDIGEMSGPDIDI